MAAAFDLGNVEGFCAVDINSPTQCPWAPHRVKKFYECLVGHSPDSYGSANYNFEHARWLFNILAFVPSIEQFSQEHLSTSFREISDSSSASASFSYTDRCQSQSSKPSSLILLSGPSGSCKTSGTRMLISPLLTNEIDSALPQMYREPLSRLADVQTTLHIYEAPDSSDFLPLQVGENPKITAAEGCKHVLQALHETLFTPLRKQENAMNHYFYALENLLRDSTQSIALQGRQGPFEKTAGRLELVLVRRLPYPTAATRGILSSSGAVGQFDILEEFHQRLREQQRCYELKWEELKRRATSLRGKFTRYFTEIQLPPTHDVVYFFLHTTNSGIPDGQGSSPLAIFNSNRPERWGWLPHNFFTSFPVPVHLSCSVTHASIERQLLRALTNITANSTAITCTRHTGETPASVAKALLEEHQNRGKKRGKRTRVRQGEDNVSPTASERLRESSIVEVIAENSGGDIRFAATQIQWIVQFCPTPSGGERLIEALHKAVDRRDSAINLSHAAGRILYGPGAAEKDNYEERYSASSLLAEVMCWTDTRGGETYGDRGVARACGKFLDYFLFNIPGFFYDTDTIDGPSPERDEGNKISAKEILNASKKKSGISDLYYKGIDNNNESEDRSADDAAFFMTLSRRIKSPRSSKFVDPVISGNNIKIFPPHSGVHSQLETLCEILRAGSDCERCLSETLNWSADNTHVISVAGAAVSSNESARPGARGAETEAAAFIPCLYLELLGKTYYCFHKNNARKRSGEIPASNFLSSQSENDPRIEVRANFVPLGAPPLLSSTVRCATVMASVKHSTTLPQEERATIAYVMSLTEGHDDPHGGFTSGNRESCFTSSKAVIQRLAALHAAVLQPPNRLSLFLIGTSRMGNTASETATTTLPYLALIVFGSSLDRPHFESVKSTLGITIGQHQTAESRKTLLLRALPQAVGRTRTRTLLSMRSDGQSPIKKRKWSVYYDPVPSGATEGVTATFATLLYSLCSSTLNSVRKKLGKPLTPVVVNASRFVLISDEFLNAHSTTDWLLKKADSIPKPKLWNNCLRLHQVAVSETPQSINNAENVWESIADPEEYIKTNKSMTNPVLSCDYPTSWRVIWQQTCFSGSFIMFSQFLIPSMLGLFITNKQATTNFINSIACENDEIENN